MFFLQLTVAFFVLTGLYSVCWNLLLFFLRRRSGASVRILIRPEGEAAAALIPELALLQDRFPRSEDRILWLVCPEDSPWHEACRQTALRCEEIRLLTPEQAEGEAVAFLRKQ